MNNKLILSSAILTSIIGVVIGITLVEINSNSDRARFDRSLNGTLVLLSGMSGLIVGAGQEITHQLKTQKKRH
ncbi:MAG: hypothetical protein QNJ38_12080 [Prochloraceae cyanobacterium]|nr:hypothetical protein [Prochloraceae cyanobacterium]